MSDDSKVLSCFGVVFFAVAIIALGSILSGWVLSILWGWFIVPQFGLPALSVPSAMGIALVVSLLTHQSSPSSDKKKDWVEIVASSFGQAVIAPITVLVFGYIVNSFM